MKRISLIPALFICLAILTAGQPAGDPILGKWKLSGMELDGKTMPQLMQEQMAASLEQIESDSTMSDSIRVQMKKETEAAMKTAMDAALEGTITFFRNGKVEFIMGGTTQTGTWKADRDRKNITITDENNRVEIWKIQTLTQTQLVLSGVSDGKTAKIILVRQ